MGTWLPSLLVVGLRFGFGLRLELDYGRLGEGLGLVLMYVRLYQLLHHVLVGVQPNTTSATAYMKEYSLFETTQGISLNPQ